MSQLTGTIRILHVDDEPDFGEVTATFLERESGQFAVETTTTASEALDRVAEADVDCIVSDYDMPEQNGIEFLEAVREEHPDIPFILFTGKGSEEVASDAISAGVSDYLQKSSEPDQYTVLANRIRNLVDAYRSQHVLAERTRRLETLISNLPGIVYRAQNEPGWPMEYVRGECEQLTGYPALALETGEVSWGADILHPDDRDEMWDVVQDTLQRKESFEVTYRIVTRGGVTKWMWERGRGVYTDDGRLDAVEGFITDITGRKEQERERERTIEFLQSLYDVATDRELTVDEKITRLLEIGPEKLGLPYGHLTRIERVGGDPGNGTQTIIEASGDHDLLQPGESCPLSRSYCRKTIETDELLEIRDALASGWADDPAYEVFGLNCYIGTAITVNDELYGTVFFASDVPREEPFTEAERTFIRLMSQLVSYELERKGTMSESGWQDERLE